MQRVPEQGLEQVFLVGEVQVEGSVGDLRAAHDVVHPDGLETALVELGEASLQQVAQRLAALCPQFPVLSGPAAERRTARPATGLGPGRRR